MGILQGPERFLMRAMPRIQLKVKMSYLMLMSGLNETIDQLPMATQTVYVGMGICWSGRVVKYLEGRSSTWMGVKV